MASTVKKLYKYDLGNEYKTKLLDGWIYIKFETTMFCNFQCSYCCVQSPKYTKGEKFEFTRENFHLVINFLKNQNANGIIFEFFGGEPTLNPDLFYFIDKLKTNFAPNLHMILMTNLSAPVELYKKLPSEMELVIGFHTAFYNIDKYLEKAVQLKDRFYKFLTILMIHKDNHLLLGPRIKDFKNLGLETTVCPLLDDNFQFQDRSEDFGIEYDSRYTQMKSEVIDSDMNPLSEREAMEIKSFKGMLCFPNINIKKDGSIEICTITKKQHIETASKVNHKVLCTKSSCTDCELANPKISISYAKKRYGKITSL